MRETYGDIWRFHPKAWVVIPTNIGWKSNGANVMGAGLARQASLRFPLIAYRYGGLCKFHGSRTPVLAMEDERLIAFPVKPLNASVPHQSWRQGADLSLIERSAAELAEMEPNLDGDLIVLPWVGCGNGGLATRDVYPILWRTLLSDRFVLCKGALSSARGEDALRDAPTQLFPSAVRPNEASAIHQIRAESRTGTRTRAADSAAEHGPREDSER